LDLLLHNIELLSQILVYLVNSIVLALDLGFKVLLLVLHDLGKVVLHVAD